MLTALIFGAFVAFLTDYWLGRFSVREPVRLAIALVVGVLLGILVYVGHQAAF